VSSLKCALACSVAGNQERRGLTAYTHLARTLKSPMTTYGGATRVQLRESAPGEVKVLIPRKMETPRLAMRIGRSARGRGRSQGYAHVDWKEIFISGNSEPLFYSVKRVYLN